MRPLGATHRRYRTPHVAIGVGLLVAGAVPATLLALGVPGQTALTALLTLASAGFLLAYLLVCLASPVFLHRIGELTIAPVVVTAVIGPALVLACLSFMVSALDGPLPAVLGGITVAAVGWYSWLRVRRPAELAGIGVYDETSAADVHAAMR